MSITQFVSVNRFSQQVVYDRLDERLLNVEWISDGNFLAALFGMQGYWIVGEDGKADHTFIADDFDTVLAGGVVGYETP